VAYPVDLWLVFSLAICAPFPSHVISFDVHLTELDLPINQFPFPPRDVAPQKKIRSPTTPRFYLFPLPCDFSQNCLCFHPRDDTAPLSFTNLFGFLPSLGQFFDECLPKTGRPLRFCRFQPLVQRPNWRGALSPTHSFFNVMRPPPPHMRFFFFAVVFNLMELTPLCFLQTFALGTLLRPLALPFCPASLSLFFRVPSQSLSTTPPGPDRYQVVPTVPSKFSLLVIPFFFFLLTQT